MEKYEPIYNDYIFQLALFLDYTSFNYILSYKNT